MLNLYRSGSRTSVSAMACISVCRPMIATIPSMYAPLLSIRSQKVEFCLQESPIFQLQTTFAALQESRMKIFNPEKLVGSLQLRTNEQQDAQECVILMFTIDPSLIAHIDFPSYSSPTWTMSSRSNLIPL
jgi:hypothetical protein